MFRKMDNGSHDGVLLLLQLSTCVGVALYFGTITYYQHNKMSTDLRNVECLENNSDTSTDTMHVVVEVDKI